MPDWYKALAGLTVKLATEVVVVAPFGAIHIYTLAVLPELNTKLFPRHTGLAAVKLAVAGCAFTVTTTLASAEVQPFASTILNV